MSGLALKLYRERQGSPENIVPHPWQELLDLVDHGYFSYIDYAFALSILATPQSSNLESAMALAFLLAASRQGHLCLKISEGRLEPRPMHVLIIASNGQSEAFIPEFGELEKSIVEGCYQLKNIEINTKGGEHPLVIEDNRYYLRKHWYYESSVAAEIKKFRSSQLRAQFDNVAIEKELENLQKEGQLLPEQARVILHAVNNPLTIVTGGPGTGKSYTAAILYRVLHDNVAGRCEFALAAPTGKAASNIKAKLPEIPAYTLHALLGIGRHRQRSLSADVVIVDESSMIDVRLMAQLFASLKAGARLILLGDKAQLPSVEAGSLFADLIELLEDQVVDLKTCLRTDNVEILELARAVKNGDNDACSFKMLEADPNNFQGAVVDYAYNQYKQGERLLPVQQFKEFNKFRVLTPVRKGSLGVEALNNLLVNRFQKECLSENFVAPIMVTKNNYEMGLMNGEVGVIICRRYSEKGFDPEYALFSGKNESEDKFYDEGSQLRKIPAILLPEYEYAYTISVHKSQGSEYDHVLVVLPEQAYCFGRDMFYTAITRARQSLLVCGSPAVVQKTIAHQVKRVSGL
ncbi:MAG: exodeoxyribonuclease V subunit alpha [Chlamydiota bacterium]